MKVMKVVDYMSLYDYLGRPAGSALGHAIATRASKHKEKIYHRDVPESPYNRPINLYRSAFLEAAFNDVALKELIEKDAREYREKRKKKQNA